MYEFKTKPRWYQDRDFKLKRNAAEVAILYQQRCGKSKLALDLMADWYERGLLDSILIIADPANVPDNWVRDSKFVPGEFQIHWPDRLKISKLCWSTPVCQRIWFKRKLDKLLEFDGCSVLAVNGEAVRTKAFREWIPKFLVKRKKIGIIFDETTLLAKNPKAQMTKLLIKLSQRYKHVVRRVILDGTPHGESPLDLFGQFELLKKGFFGYPSFTAFKNHFAVWEKKHTVIYTNMGLPKNIEYNSIKMDDNGEKIFLHLDELTEKMKRVSVRVTRKDAWKNYHEPIFQTIRFDMSAKQKKVYMDLVNEFETEFPDVGMISVQNVLTRYLRLQQVTSNFWPPQEALELCPNCDGEGCEACDGTGAVAVKTPLIRISEDNPRLNALMGAIPVIDGKIIHWARYHQEIDDIMAALKDAGRNPVRYDGTISKQDQLESEIAFQTGDATDIVANAAALARGKKLSSGNTHIIYSNYFSLLTRLQLQDRAEDYDKTEPTTIIDLVANGTVDEKIAGALRSKRKIGDCVMGEGQSIWI